jgi:hypothetical protein
VRPATLNISGQPETGELRRNVGLAGFSFRATQKIMVSADYEGSPGDQSYFRTSRNEYQQLRARTRFEVLRNLQMNLGFLYFTNENPLAGSSYEFRNVLGSASFRWQPGGGHRVSVFGEYSYGSLKSNISILVPPFYSLANSGYRDNAHTATTLVDITIPTSSGIVVPKLSLGGSLFHSSGSRPTQYYQPIARFLLPVHKHVSGMAEWRYYGMSQTFYSYEGFRTHHLIVGLQLSL